MINRTLLLLLLLQAATGGLAITVSWEVGIHGVREGERGIEICAFATNFTSNFTLALTHTAVKNTAVEGVDYILSDQLSWLPGNNKSCVFVEIIDDIVVENEEILIIHFHHVVGSDDSVSIEGARTTMVMIFDNDPLLLGLSPQDVTVLEGSGDVEFCLSVMTSYISPGLSYHINLDVQTTDGTAAANEDFLPVSNVTNNTLTLLPLTPMRRELCFSLNILSRVGSGTDRRVFSLTVTGTDSLTGKEVDVVGGETTTITITSRNETFVVRPGDIIDSVIGDPLYTVAIDTLHGHDYNLCYEIHGENNTVLNLLSDECFFVNAAYDAVVGAPKRNIIDRIMIRVTDNTGTCVDLSVLSSEECETVHVRPDPQEAYRIQSTFSHNGVEFNAQDGKIRILLPCAKYPGNGIGLNIECPDRFLDTATGMEHVDRRLRLEFQRAKLPPSTTLFPSGLVGQFWHLGFGVSEFNGTFYDGSRRTNSYEVSHPLDVGYNRFVGLGYGITWDYRDETCIYAGDNQAGSSILVSYPADPVIQGSYLDYKLYEPFGEQYKYSVFDRFGCAPYVYG